MQYLGVDDIEVGDLSVGEELKYALANLHEREGGYVVRHGAHPVSDFGFTRKS